VVSVINTITNLRVKSVRVGANCFCLSPDSIAVAPDVGRLYVVNEFAKTVSVIDIASNAVVATIAIGGSPNAIATSPDGSQVYVLNGSGGAAVVAIDTATNDVVTIAPLAVLQARGMAITPDGAHLYVSTLGANSVIVVATASMSVMATIPVGKVPLGVDITPDGSHAYVAASASNAVYAIDTATNEVVATIPVDNEPQSASITPDGTRAYVANMGSGTVSVINTQTYTVMDTVVVHPVSTPNPQPRALSVSPDGTRVYLATDVGVQVIDTATNAVIGPIPFVESTQGFPAALVIGRAAGGNAPTGVNESYGTNLNTPLSVPAAGVLANDHSNGGGAMTTQLVNGVDHGTLSLNPNGSFSYMPPPGFSGTDSLSYRAVNGVGSSNIATVTLSVVTGPQPPAGLYISAIVGNTVTLRWTPPAMGDTPTGYVLEGGVLPGEVLASLPTNSTAPMFTFAAPTGTFYIRMHTVSGANKSVASTEIRLVVNVPARPSAPVHLLGIVNGSNLSLKWRNTFEGGAPTNLLLHVAGSLSATLLLPPDADGISLDDVPAGTYTLRLSATNAAGFSGVSNSVTVTFPGPCTGVPKAPIQLVASRDGNVITVLWESATSGPAATGFMVNVSGSFVGSFPALGRSLSGAVGAGSYTISVSAANACGVSSPTAEQTLIVP
jgi:YVTN family beta-propeller protein